MRVLIFDTAEKAVVHTARLIVEQVQARGDSVLGLATGATMVPIYAALRAAYRAGQISFAQVTTFNLDEYLGLSPADPRSYRATMQAELFDHVDIDPARTHLPIGDTPDPKAEAARYEAAIAAAGGIDLQLLGIGRNGHIGFNEPISSLTSRTRVKALTPDTRAANAHYFPDDDMPRFALTMGVGTIMEARHCLMLATGPAKADAVAATIEGPLSAACPASVLQMHRRATVVLDRSAAGRLKLWGHYAQVEEDR
ncbi:MAG: glucosamine-6-phosphate deaminase [Paracoccus sp. (in: a-proteobacteria)]|nr:glucosamine-6-phosphate deaminase [Paracoccus sp. (in: a-proteobacteria)]